ncbi:TonB-dependent receptor plug domain-containing protein [Holophaga foetida]|uniref:TonB-dependent receptor plug domain-containing protein n=1 Tax=Holophaga foetida TaxID=35839 RepID=UPI000247539F|nr:TonB-dependent receptor [Holophaga foetida]
MNPLSHKHTLPLGLLLATLPSAAAEPADLQEVIVTATAVKEAKKDVPASVQVVSQDDIKNSTSRNAGDLIAEAGIGHVTKYNGCLTGSIGIRGLQSNWSSSYTSRVLILINGSRAGTVNLAKIPAQDIERIEIVKGPASVLFGSAAMGGVVNIITKEGTKDGCHGALGVEGGSWDYWKVFGEAQGKVGKLDFSATLSREGQGDYEAADYGTIENSGYKAETLSTRLGYEIAAGHHLSLGYQHWKGWDIGSQGATYSADPDDYNNKKRDALDLNYRTESLQAKYYYVADRDEWYSNADYSSGPGTDALDKTDTDTQGLSLQKTFTVGDHRIVTGGQWDRIKVQSVRTAGSPYNPNSRYDSYGAFAEGRMSLLEKRLLVSAGLRFDRFENSILDTPGLSGMTAKDDSLDHTTVRGGVVYKLTESITIKANAGTAFRAPAPLELAADYYSWGTHYVGNAGLSPEKSTTVDMGIEVVKGAFRGDVSYFHTDFKDKIVSYYSSALTASTYRNAGEAKLEGFEMNASYDLGAALRLRMVLEPYAHINYLTRFEEKASGAWSTLTSTPKWSASAGMKLGQESWDAQFIASYHGHEWATDWNSSSSTYGLNISKGGFVLLSLKGAYRPLKAIELTASVENILNRCYEYNLGYPMAERTFVGGAKWLF